MNRKTVIILLLCEAIKVTIFLAFVLDDLRRYNLDHGRKNQINLYVQKANSNGADGFLVSTNGRDWAFATHLPYISKQSSDQILHELHPE